MAVKTRLTERLGVKHPVLSAPMAFVAGGKLASAVTRAGGLGLIGGGYGDAEWLDKQFRAAGNTPVGCGFITWSLAYAPNFLSKCSSSNLHAYFFPLAILGPLQPRSPQPAYSSSARYRQ